MVTTINPIEIPRLFQRQRILLLGLKRSCYAVSSIGSPNSESRTYFSRNWDSLKFKRVVQDRLCWGLLNSNKVVEPDPS